MELVLYYSSGSGSAYQFLLEHQNQYTELVPILIKPAIKILNINKCVGEMYECTSPCFMSFPGMLTISQWRISLLLGSARDGASGSERNI